MEQGRYSNIPRSERKCNICGNNDIEDEFHFVLICPTYRDLREQYIPLFYWRRAGMFKFVNLLNTTKKQLLHKLAIYIIKANKVRNSVINIPV